MFSRLKSFLISSFLLFTPFLLAKEAVLIKRAPAMILVVKHEPAFLPQHDLSLTSGYIWKNDKEFKRLYGHGIRNVGTVAGTVYLWPHLGLGAQLGYWTAKGKEQGCDLFTFRNQDGYLCLHAHPRWQRKYRLHQVPMLAYLKARTSGRLQAYALMGFGAVFAKERVNERSASRVVPAFTAEIGAKFYFCPCFFGHVALHWINSHRRMPEHQKRLDFGGRGIRAGLGGSF